MKINKYHFLYIIISFALCLYAYLLMGQSSMGSVDELLQKTAIVGLLEILFCTITWKLYTGSFFSLFLFYLLSFYIFTMGQSLLYAFNIEHSFANVYILVSKEAMLKSHVFTILCIAFLFEGALIAAGKKTTKYTQIEIVENCESGIFGQVGVILLMISVIPMIIYLVSLLISYRAGGYAYAFSSVSNTSGLMRIITKIYPFCVPSLIMIIIGYSGFYRKAAQVFMGLIGIIYFMIGERTGAASIILALFILDSNLKERTQTDDRPNRSGQLKLVLLIVLFAVFIPVVGALRNTSNMSISSLTEAVMENGLFAGITDTIATMGFSEFPLGKTIEIVPGLKSYAYGQSYFYAILAILPNIFGGTHISVKYAGLAQWLMDFLNMNYGPGFSYPAEAWYNFGWLGCIFMLVIGYVFSYFLYIPKGTKVNNTTLFLSLAFFEETITSPRRELMTVVRQVGYYVLIPVLLIYLFRLRSRRA